MRDKAGSPPARPGTLPCAALVASVIMAVAVALAAIPAQASPTGSSSAATVPKETGSPPTGTT